MRTVGFVVGVLLTLLFTAAAANISAQITLIGTGTEPLRSVLSLQAGPKLIKGTYDGGDITLHNTDLTIYRMLTVPPPPSGYTWSGATYITDELFDTDPTTIEFLLAGTGQPLQSATYVVREDGSVLFSAVPGLSTSYVATDIND